MTLPTIVCGQIQIYLLTNVWYMDNNIKVVSNLSSYYAQYTMQSDHVFQLDLVNGYTNSYGCV